MMYSEFVTATNCKQNENNYKVFQALEQIYMSRDDITKEQIYTAAAGLLDNSKSPEELELIEKYNREKATCEEYITWNNHLIAEAYRNIAMYTETPDADAKSNIKSNRDSIKQLKEENKSLEREVKQLEALIKSIQ